MRKEKKGEVATGKETKAEEKQVEEKLTEEKRPDEKKGAEKKSPHRPIWSGSVSIGLVNVPVKVYPMTRDLSVHFHLLHRKDGQPLRYERVCTRDGKVVPWEETVKGFEVRRNEFITFEKEELRAALPESDRRILIDRFVHYLSLDPVFFENSFALVPDGTPDAYSLLYAVCAEKGMAGVGRFTMRTKEYPAVVHAYHGALILTTLRYANEVMDPSAFEELKGLPTPVAKQLDLAKRIIAEPLGRPGYLRIRGQLPRAGPRAHREEAGRRDHPGREAQGGGGEGADGRSRGDGGEAREAMTIPRYTPMLARTADAPFSSPDWIFEVKWDGIRAIAYVGETLSILSRNGKEMSGQFPELGEMRELAPGCVLDGEIVLLRDGRNDIQALMGRFQESNPRQIEADSRSLPVTFVAFDILERDGVSLIELPIEERRRILEDHVKEGKYLVRSLAVQGEGERYYDEAVKRGLEGVVAKRLGSPYEPGARSGYWLKVKAIRTCDCVVFGYTKGEGARAGTFGALVLGLCDQEQGVYIGRVGTGFDQADLEDILSKLEGLKADGPTLTGADKGEIVWVHPRMVVEVAYHSVTKDGTAPHAPPRPDPDRQEAGGVHAGSTR